MKRTTCIVLLTLLNLTFLAQTAHGLTTASTVEERLRAAAEASGTGQGETTLHGTWHGILQLNSLKLNLVLHLTNDSTCTLDSPDQGAKDIAGVVKELTAEKIVVQFPLILASYTAELKDDMLKGTFKQRNFALPLTMERGDLVRRRPQTPQPPFPYETREVSIAPLHRLSPQPLPVREGSDYSQEAQDKGLRGQRIQEVQGERLSTPLPHRERQGEESVEEESVTISGTLTLPPSLREGTGVGSCVLLVTGSGLQDRDETLFDHKPFAVIADYLARHGIATLRYDDRGFDPSTGDVSQYTTADFASDAEAALAYLRSLKMFSKVGILGHSEGGAIAFMLASRRDDTPFTEHPDFIVTLAAPGIRGDTLIVEQTNALLRMNGQPESMTVKRMHLTMAMQPQGPWYEYFVAYDPADDIRSTHCPVLALNGSLDCQVLPQSNLTAIRQFSALNPQLSTKEYPGLNHLFQHATTGAPTEYGTIEETISEEVLSDIATWVNSLK
ncbi:MAG: alpha/beta fold hydrolase [Prevotella sp.]|nr:alpha/beta fold hydrolase [Prevotella sp.]